MAALVLVFIGSVCIDFQASAANAELPTGEDIKSPGDHRLKILTDESYREYTVHVPDKLTLPPAVVIMFHGGGGNGSAAARETGWSELADREHFLAVYPEGSRANPDKRARFIGNPQTWNDGSERTAVGAVERKVDDIKFIRALIEELKAKYQADQKRILVSGFSNGASMAFRVGRELSELVAAIAPVSGSDWLSEPDPKDPMPLIYFAGLADQQNPYEGGKVRLAGGSFGVKPPVMSFIRRWAKLLNCPEEPQIALDKNGVRESVYGPGKAGSEVRIYTIEGMGHTWPGGKSLLPSIIVGSTSSKIDATEVIWRFFLDHPKS